MLLLDSPDWAQLLAGQGSPPPVSMPMFHSNAIMAGWAVGLAGGAALVLRRRFSASQFLPDVRAFGATYANYVGKPLCYVLGRLPAGVEVLDPDPGIRCPVAEFDGAGQLINAGESVGELVSTSGRGMFAGYYNDPDADEQRLRGGQYWSGDLGYVDEKGFCYFAGRTGDWLRVDGENLGTAPIERILLRHPGLAEVAVYAVPDAAVGDQVMAAVVPRAGVDLDVGGLGAFLASQGDLGPRGPGLVAAWPGAGVPAADSCRCCWPERGPRAACRSFGLIRIGSWSRPASSASRRVIAPDVRWTRAG